MKKNPDIEKFCKNCGGKIERKYSNGRIEDYARYLAREHCKQSCYLEMRKKEASLPPEPVMTKAEMAAKFNKDFAAAEALEELTPLEFMLREMNRPSNSLSYRKEMAALAAPYMHPKLDAKSNKTKKEERVENATRVAAGSKFAPVAPPNKVIGRIG